MAALALFLVIVRWPFAWTGNEENYFLLAHRLIAPDEYPQLHAVFDDGRGRWLGLAIFGILSDLLGFDRAHLLLALLSILGVSVGLAAVARMLRLGIIEALTVLLTFLALRQSIVGGEWFIGGVETKAFAYAAGLCALALAHSGRAYAAAALVAFAVYCHILVGGFWLIAVSIFLSSMGPAAKPGLTRFLSSSLLLASPAAVAALLAMEPFTPPSGLPDADFIYSILRAPHHVAPFAEVGGWADEALLAGAGGLLMGLTSVLVARRVQDPALRSVLLTVAAGSAYLPMAVVISWLDRSEGSLAKFYLFRPASPLLLLALFGWAGAVRSDVSRRPRQLAFSTLLFASILDLALTDARWPWPHSRRDWNALAQSVERSTSPAEVVLIDPKLDHLSSLPRLIRRPTVVSWKFVPTNPRDIYRWYALVQWRQSVFRRGCADRAEGIGLVIVARDAIEPVWDCGRLVHEEKDLQIIDLHP